MCGASNHDAAAPPGQRSMIAWRGHSSTNCSSPRNGKGTTMTTTAESKAVVQGIYDAVMRQDMDAFAAALDPALLVSSAPYFANGGPDSKVDQWQSMLAGLAPVLEIEGISLVSLFGEDDQVSATVRAPLREGKGEVLF